MAICLRGRANGNAAGRGVIGGYPVFERMAGLGPNLTLPRLRFLLTLAHGILGPTRQKPLRTRPEKKSQETETEVRAVQREDQK